MQLLPHPESHWSPWQVTFDAVAANSTVHLTFVTHGDLASLVVPAPASPARKDELWRHMCFEWFVADPDGPAYSEWNFAFSGGWAAYDFDDHRQGMRQRPMESAPSIATRREDLALVVTVALPWSGTDPALFGASAVLEHLDGRRAYHALAHQPGPPNFHARACFTGVLGGREGA